MLRLPRQLPGRPDDCVDTSVGERGDGLIRFDWYGCQLVGVDSFADRGGAKFQIKDIARRQAPELRIEERADRRKIAIGAVVDRSAAPLKDRRQQHERRALRAADQQLHRSGPELRASFDDLTDGVDRGGARCRTRLDLDLDPGFPVEAFPQRRVIAGELELRPAMELEYDLFGGDRRSRIRRLHQREAAGAPRQFVERRYDAVQFRHSTPHASLGSAAPRIAA